MSFNVQYKNNTNSANKDSKSFQYIMFFSSISLEVILSWEQFSSCKSSLFTVVDFSQYNFTDGSIHDEHLLVVDLNEVKLPISNLVHTHC